MKEIVIIMGFPASGKSTTVNQYVSKGYSRLNRDTHGGTMEDMHKLADKYLGENDPLIVLDNLYPSVKSRAGIVAVAKKHKARIVCVHMSTSMEDSMLNACLRMMQKHGVVPGPEHMKDYGDPNTFPVAVIYKYRKEFQKPTLAEGFDQVIAAPFVRTWGPDFINKAVIIDYDGTVRLSTGPQKFPTKKSEIKMLPGREKVLRAYKDKGYYILGASNQSGVAKGQVTSEAVNECFHETNRLLGDVVDNFLFCPHRVPPISCFCRKPNPGMGAFFIYKYKLRPSECIMVGDMGSDKSYAARCGFQFADANQFFK